MRRRLHVCTNVCMRVLFFLLLQLDKVVAVVQNATRWAGYVAALKGALAALVCLVMVVY